MRKHYSTNKSEGMINRSGKNSDFQLGMVLETWSIFSDLFKGLSEQYNQNDHDHYFNWLKNKIIECIKKDVFFEGLRSMGIDWVTVHYKTRHHVQEWSKKKEWMQSAVPISTYMAKYENDLQVYEKSESPYIKYFAEHISGGRNPLQILFHIGNSHDKSEDWLLIDEPFSQNITKITEDNSEQEDFTKEEVDKFLKINPITVKKIESTFLKLSDKQVTTAKFLGWLRNSCRVTFLALKKKDPEIKLPRIVILSPVYVEGGNIIGGIAYVGSKELSKRDTNILKTFSDSLLSNIRLREEGLRETRISYLEELSNARAEFVQRISHSIQNPADSLHSSIEKISGLFKEIENASDDLRKAASNIMKTFSSENVDDFLTLKRIKVNIRDFIDTLVFRNENIFRKANKTLTVNDIPEDWNFEVDKTVFWEVMINLLDNARIFAEKTVTLEVEKKSMPGEGYTFRVIDDGPGVDPTIKNNLFKPGIRGKNRPGNRKEFGHGFGLYLSYRAVKKHGGELYLNESSKKGTEFVIEIPVN